jgi:hypothetical protein
MSDNDSEEDRCVALAEKIIELCDTESNVNVITALTCALTKFFARVCPDCRRRVVKHLKKSFPDMLRNADALAKCNDEATCH